MLVHVDTSGQLREPSLEHLAHEVAALRSLIREQGTGAPAKPMDATADQPVLHHPEVEHARSETDPTSGIEALDRRAVGAPEIEREVAVGILSEIAGYGLDQICSRSGQEQQRQRGGREQGARRSPPPP